MISLLSTNQTHILQKSSFNWFSILLNLYVEKKEMYNRHGEKRSHLTACDMSLTYIKNKSGPRMEPCGTPQDTDTGWEKLFYARNDLLDK